MIKYLWLRKWFHPRYTGVDLHGKHQPIINWEVDYIKEKENDYHYRPYTTYYKVFKVYFRPNLRNDCEKLIYERRIKERT